MPSQLKLKNLSLCQKTGKWRKKMKAMGKVTLTLGLMIIVSLFLTSCSGVVTPELQLDLDEDINTVTPETASGNLENQEDIYQSSNNSQNSSTGPVEEPVTENTEEPGTGEVDTTKPVITGSRDPLPNSFGWNNTDVTVSFSCADTGSVQSGIDINTLAGATVTTEGKDQSVTNTGECIDAAGNVADSVTVSGINIDKTPPVVTITLPKNGKYGLNESVTATWSATDALSGVISPVSGTVSIDTSSVGTKTFTIPAGTAKDKAGNSSLKVTISYSVIEDTEEPVMWSGLGMGAWCSDVDDYINTWLNNGFIDLRLDIPSYQDTALLAASKAKVITAVAAGARVIWGVSSNSFDNPGYTITTANWLDFRAAILDAAQWAQANGVYEFQLGNEEGLHIDGTTMTLAQLIINIKSVATEVKDIFTNGNISYSCYQDVISDWITAGKGDIDIMALNIYREWGTHNAIPWKSKIDNMVSAFGIGGTYITEFGLHTDGLDNYSTDEVIQAVAVAEMIEYIKASGIERALFFFWKGDDFGAMKTDGTYRLLWNQALLNSGSVKFATVPAKTATISLPDTIALIHKITQIAPNPASGFSVTSTL